jgi:hypothetical protein
MKAQTPPDGVVVSRPHGTSPLLGGGEVPNTLYVRSKGHGNGALLVVVLSFVVFMRQYAWEQSTVVAILCDSKSETQRYSSRNVLVRQTPK